MNKQLIKKFKKYLKSKSAFYIYLKMYRDCRLSINPASLEEYLRQTKPQLAIPGAFVYPKPEVSIYDRDYWLALHEGWMELLDTIKEDEMDAMLLSDIDFLDVEKRCSVGLGKDKASLNLRSGNRLTFNQEHSRKIVESGLKLVSLGTSRTTGDVLLMVSNQRGITYTVTEMSRKRTGHNVVVGSKDFCEKLSRLLDIDADYTILQCELVGQNVRMILFRITL